MKYRALMLLIWALCMAAGLAGCVRMLGYIIVGSDRAWRSARSYDRVGNVAIGGDDRETISSHANTARTERRRWGCWLCALLDKVERDHCANSVGT